MNSRPEGGRDLVIFDLDDTLTETSRALKRARSEVLDQIGGLKQGRELLERAHDLWRAGTWIYGDDDLGPVLDLVCRLMDRSLPWDFDVRRWQAMYHARELQLVRARRPVVDAAARLQMEGVTVAIVSNGSPDRQAAKIARLGLDRLIPTELTVICDGSNIPPKPSPIGILSVIAAVRPRRTVVIGDRSTDIVAGRLAGARTLLLRVMNVSVEPETAVLAALSAHASTTPSGCYRAIGSLLHGDLT